MNEYVYKVSDAILGKHHKLLGFRILVMLTILSSFIIVSSVVDLGYIFLFVASFLFILGSIYSYLDHNNKHKFVKILLSVFVCSFLFICKCCSLEFDYSIDIKVFVAYAIIVLQVIYSLHCPQLKNLKMATYVSLTLIALCVAINFTQNWAFGISFYMLLLLIVYYFYDIISRGYKFSFVSQALEDNDYWLMAKTIGFIIILSALIFSFIPRFHFNYMPYRLSDYNNLQNTSNLNKLSLKNFFNGNLFKGFRENSKNGGETNDPESNLSNKKSKKDNQLICRIQTNDLVPIRKIAYDKYTGNSWKISDTYKAILIKPEYFNTFQIPQPPEKYGNYYRITHQKFVIENYSSNLFLTSYKMINLYMGDEGVVVDKNYNFLRKDILSKDFSYDTTIALPESNLQMLTFYNGEVEKNDFKPFLELPKTVTPRTIALAQKLTLIFDTTAEKIYKIQNYLKYNYKYSNQIQNIPKGKDAVDYFLFESKTGTDEDFSTSLAILLRCSNVPTRYVKGYIPSLYNPFTNFYDVKASDEISWVEAYIPDYDWIGLYQNSSQFSVSFFLLDLLKYLYALFMTIPFGGILFTLILTIALIFSIYLLIKYIIKRKPDEIIHLYLKLCKKMYKYGLRKSNFETALNFLDRIKACVHNNKQNSKYTKLSKNLNKIEQITNQFIAIRFGKAYNEIDNFKTNIKNLLREL